MTGEQLLVYLQQMTREERAGPILVHLETEDDDEVMGVPLKIHSEYDCNDQLVLRLNGVVRG